MSSSSSAAAQAFMAEFVLPPRYEVMRPVGRGSFGTLVAARDHQKGGRMVAIKKVEGGGGTLGTDRQDTKKLLREMRLLQHFKHENIMTLHDILTPAHASASASAGGCSSSSPAACSVSPPADAASSGGASAETAAATSATGGWRKTFYLVQDLQDTDLHRVIQSAAKGQQPLSEQHVRCFVYQTLRGIYACHSAQVLHRDLKPSNLLVNKDCTLRIGDFGLARGVTNNAANNSLTEYVVTRWYRAPELLCGNESYGPPIDLWSIGCILAELLGKAPLFPGRDVLSQLRLIVQIVGVPKEDVLRRCIDNDKAIEFIQGIGKAAGAQPPPPLASLYPDAPPLAVDLLCKLLEFDPSKRISAADALRHPWMRELHELNAEPTAAPFDFSFEDADDVQLRELLDDELRRFHPDTPPSTEPPATPPSAATPLSARSAATLGGPASGGGGANSAVGSSSSRQSSASGSRHATPGGAASKARSAAKGSTAAERGGVGKRRRG